MTDAHAWLRHATRRPVSAYGGQVNLVCTTEGYRPATVYPPRQAGWNAFTNASEIVALSPLRSAAIMWP